MLRLGINEGINSSVVVAEGGRILFALQEERVRRFKNYMGFPDQALTFALRELDLTPAKIDRVCLSNQVSVETDRASFLAAYRRRARTPLERVRETEGSDLWRALRRRVRGGEKTHEEERAKGEAFCAKHLRAHGLLDRPRVRTHHHLNHAASAYFGCRPDPDQPVLVLTLDGGGDSDCAHVYRGEGGELHLLERTPHGHSVGNVYSVVTHFLGLTPHEHEYKLMGMAGYTDPERTEAVARILGRWLDVDGLRFRSRVPERTSQLEARCRRELRNVRFDTLAGGLQRFTEDLVVRWVRAAIKQTGIGRVVCAGGVFMNVKLNKLLAELPEVEFFDVFPSCGDETLPFGAVWLDHARSSPGKGADIALDSLYLGPDAEADLPSALERYAGRVVVRKLEEPAKDLAALLAEGTIVARCSGRMEFGARSLGNRSILADPSDPRIVPLLNKSIKRRDFWMPFAPAVRREDAEDYVRIPSSLPSERVSPWMMHTFDTTERRGDLTAAVHAYDGTARAQVVHREVNPGFHAVLEAFHARTGRGVLLNTSFNLHGYPIVQGSEDAIDVLLRSGLTHLVIGDHLITKGEE